MAISNGFWLLDLSVESLVLREIVPICVVSSCVAYARNKNTPFIVFYYSRITGVFFVFYCFLFVFYTETQ